jgi:spoIIIJ-associated protein
VKKSFTGKTVEAAVENAAKELGMSSDMFTYEVDTLPKKGFLGIGAVLAKIVVNYEVSVEDRVEEYLAGLFRIVGLEGCKTSITVDGDNIGITIDGDDADIFTQRQGEELEALQWIIALSLNRDGDTKYRVTLNINNYREKIKERLEALAAKTAKQVLKTQRRVTLNPMSAFQRRIIHTYLQNEENITTYSVGSEPNRKVVVSYQGEDRKPQGGRNYGKKNGGKQRYDNNKNESGEITLVEGEKRAPRPAGDAKPVEKRGNYGKKPYKKQYSDRNRQPRKDAAPDMASAPSEPTVELRAGEKRAQRPEKIEAGN